MDFKLRLNHDVFEDNPELRTVPEFSGATFSDRMMKYVMLVAWYKSPLRMKDLEDRKFKAAIWAGYKLEKDSNRPDVNMRNVITGKVATIEAAIRAMRALNPNEWKIVEGMQCQIDEILDVFKKPGKTIVEIEKAAKLMGLLPELLKRKKEVLEILNFSDQDSVGNNEEVVKDTIIEKSILDEYNENL
jgi:hypothetical protein